MRKILIVLSLALAVSMPVTAFAAASDAPASPVFRSWCGINASTLTDPQKSDWNDTFQKMIDLRKDYINQMVENGTITKSQGDAAIARIDDMAKYRQENTSAFGFGGRGMGRGFGGCPFYPTTEQ